jgi:hypothetical protein
MGNKLKTELLSQIKRHGSRIAKELTAMHDIDPEEIDRLALRFWQERGCPDASHDEDWLRAEQELRRQQSLAEPLAVRLES